MTYLNIVNGNGDDAQIDLGSIEGLDIWEGLYNAHPEMWDLVGDDCVVDITEDFWGSNTEVCTVEELRAFLEVE